MDNIELEERELEVYEARNREIEELNKVIDLMAKDIYNSDLEFICDYKKQQKECLASPCDTNCIREYYFKKARGEEK